MGLDFLVSRQFPGKDPIIWGLEKLGFPWILSSETRLINGLRRFFLNFFGAVPGRLVQEGVNSVDVTVAIENIGVRGVDPVMANSGDVENVIAGSLAGARDCSSCKSSVISDFLQLIVVSAASIPRPSDEAPLQGPARWRQFPATSNRNARLLKLIRKPQCSTFSLKPTDRTETITRRAPVGSSLRRRLPIWTSTTLV